MRQIFDAKAIRLIFEVLEFCQKLPFIKRIADYTAFCPNGCVRQEKPLATSCVYQRQGCTSCFFMGLTSRCRNEENVSDMLLEDVWDMIQTDCTTAPSKMSMSSS
ncbi:hypothetical protein LSM04_009546 [Trypanosoma melophagium]|uniref:uncharacterized protein n=1 Tax=Trypanosoma melophagium TaxID=715481 RepID=UPI00351AA736|nr:hypothetical protein LSM04_009546 [Trypanosoma melophagium]